MQRIFRIRSILSKLVSFRAPAKAGMHILINGAGGGVGTFAMQIATAMDTHVTAVCSTSKIDVVKELGADEIIDYATDNFVRHSISFFRTDACAGRIELVTGAKVLDCSDRRHYKTGALT